MIILFVVMVSPLPESLQPNLQLQLLARSNQGFSLLIVKEPVPLIIMMIFIWQEHTCSSFLWRGGLWYSKCSTCTICVVATVNIICGLYWGVGDPMIINWGARDPVIISQILIMVWLENLRLHWLVEWCGYGAMVTKGRSQVGDVMKNHWTHN